MAPAQGRRGLPLEAIEESLLRAGHRLLVSRRSMEDDPQEKTADRQRGPYLFAGIQLGGPLEELDAAAGRKLEVLAKLGEAREAERCSRAYELARAKLQAVLEARKTAAGS
jgi:hypothetical protein